MTHDEFCAYYDTLQPGERVCETTPRHMMTGCLGTVYISDTPGQAFGSKCVMWDAREYAEGSGRMGTSVTGGTRRLVDAIPLLDEEHKLALLAEFNKELGIR